MPFQLSAHSKSFKLCLEEKRKINNENKQAFGTGVPLPPPFFVKWNPSPNRVNGKKTRANVLKEVLAELDLCLYVDPNKVKMELRM